MWLGWWKRVRDGTLTKVRFAGRLHAQREFRARFRAMLARGAACGCAKTAGVCAEILKVEAALWMFARVEGRNARSAALLVVSRAVVRLPQRGGLPVRGAAAQRGANLAAAWPSRVGVFGGGLGRVSSRLASSQTTHRPLNGYEIETVLFCPISPQITMSE